MTPPSIDLRIIAPELILTGAAVAVMVWGLFLPPHRQAPLRWLASAGLVASGWQVLAQGVWDAPAFSGMYVRDALTVVLQPVALLAALLALWLSAEYVERMRL